MRFGSSETGWINFAKMPRLQAFKRYLMLISGGLLTFF